MNRSYPRGSWVLPIAAGDFPGPKKSMEKANGKYQVLLVLHIRVVLWFCATAIRPTTCLCSSVLRHSLSVVPVVPMLLFREAGSGIGENPIERTNRRKEISSVVGSRIRKTSAGRYPNDVAVMVVFMMWGSVNTHVYIKRASPISGNMKCEVVWHDFVK